MSELVAKKTIVSTGTVNKELILLKLEKLLKKDFNKVKITNGHLSCRAKTKLFNPILSVDADITVKTNNNKASVMIDGETKTNLWFWVTFLVGCTCPPLLWIMMIFMWKSQKSTTVLAISSALDQLDFELGVI